MRRIQTRQAVHFQSTDKIADVNQGNGTQCRNYDDAFGIHFPFFMPSLRNCSLRLGELAVPLVLPRELLLLQKGRDARSTGQSYASEVWIFLQFSLNRRGSPARILSAHLTDPIPELKGKLPQSATGRSPHPGKQTRSAFPLVLPSPLAHRPNRAAHCCRDLAIGFSSFPSYTNFDSFFKARPSSWLGHSYSPCPRYDSPGKDSKPTASVNEGGTPFRDFC